VAWEIHVTRPAEKELSEIPRRDRERIFRGLAAMRTDPFSGDMARLKTQATAWRRRVGNWRVFFDLYPDRKLVSAIRRRTSTTY
jgi:mRNA-degrading endonuclease RelE of RelBE toxin-antitoxin system